MSSQPSSNSRTVAWTVWMIASVFYAYQYIIRVMPNIMLDDIMQQFQISAATFGQFSGIYYIGYSAMHLPIGLMLDRFGARRVMSACMLVTVIGLLPLIFCDYWVYPIIGRALIGMGSSAAILGVFKIVRMSFSEAKFARMLSISVTIGLVGAIWGGGPVSYMREALGYQTVVQIFAAMGVLLAAITYWIVPDGESAPQTSALADIKEVFSNTKVMLFCVFAGMMVGPLEGFADVWGTRFLKEVYGFDSTLAASLPSMMFIGMCFGGPILSYVADKIGSYLLTIIGAGFIMALCFTLFLAFPLSSQALTLNFGVVGVCCAYQILAVYQASKYAAAHVAGLTTAVANMIIMVFGYVFHSVMGGIVASLGGSSAPGALVYGVTVIPIALSLASLGCLIIWIRDRANKPAEEALAA